MTRGHSETIFVKLFNNFIKNTLINQFCKYIKYGYEGNELSYEEKRVGISVLDLCCGRGGDLFKWKNQDVVHYVGVDLSQALVEEAQRRYNNEILKGDNKNPSNSRTASYPTRSIPLNQGFSDETK